jgi:hypothetical protein
MKSVYKFTAQGWVRVRRCASFEHACHVARELMAATGIAHCVNT